MSNGQYQKCAMECLSNDKPEWKIIKVFTILVCIGLFFWNTFSIFQEFVNKKTVVTSTEEPSPDDKIEFPSIVVCNESAYINNSGIFSVEAFLNRTLDPWEVIHSLVPNEEHWSFETIYTVYRGRCLVMTCERKVLPRRQKKKSGRF